MKKKVLDANLLCSTDYIESRIADMWDDIADDNGVERDDDAAYESISKRVIEMADPESFREKLSVALFQTWEWERVMDTVDDVVLDFIWGSLREITEKGA